MSAFPIVWKAKVSKQLDKLPMPIQLKFYAWVTAAQLAGLRELRRRPGFHDEPLKGARLGQRSVRLNRSYRIIYVELKKEGIVEILEVNKHEY